jgi:hypothetical protein
MGVTIAPFPLCAESDAQPSWGGASLRADVVEKIFSVPERRRIFQERLPVENIDSNISYRGFCYCPSWRVRRSLIDFFNSIGHQQTLLMLKRAESNGRF